MIRLSIVIPKTADGADFEETLVSVLGNRPVNTEVIVVTAGDYDDPYELADEVDFVVAEPGDKLLNLINAGFKRARGEIVHVLLCGAEVQEGWTEPALKLFDEPTVGSVSPLVLLPLDKDRVAAAGVRIGMGLTRRLAGAGQLLGESLPNESQIAGPTLAAAFYRRRAISRICGVDPAVGPIFADLDVALSLKRIGFSNRFEPASRVSSEVRQRQDGSSFSNAQCHERLFWRHCNSLASLPWHILQISAEFLYGLPRGRAFPMLAGRLYGMLCAPWDRYTRHRTSLSWPREYSHRGISEQEDELGPDQPAGHQIRKTAA